MIGRKESGIHAIVEGQWFTCFAQKRLHSDGERSETAVETDHEKRGVIVGMGGGDFRKLGFGEAEWLLAENVLTGIQGCNRLRGVQMMSRSDDDGVHIGMMNDFIFVC